MNIDNAINRMRELPKEIGDKKTYKMWFSPLINVMYSALGNTAGIWIGYILIKKIFFGIWGELEWPGIGQLINDGVVLLISFSFLASILYQSTRRLKINLFNILSSIILVIVSAYYARVIAIELSENAISDDTAVYTVSLASFWGSLVLFYINLVYEKYIQFGDARKNRNSDYNQLETQFDG